MIRNCLALVVCLVAAPLLHPADAHAQLQDDIPYAEVPAPVKQVLEQYMSILLTSKDLDECAARFTKIAGGNLVNEDGLSLRGGVQPYGLKKDFTNAQFYAKPFRVTRAKRVVSNGDGFGPSALRGKRYTIWIAKKDGVGGVPAPISITVAEGHAFVKTPKVTGIGSL